MSTGEKKPQTPPSQTPPQQPPPQPAIQTLPKPVKNPLVSRRTFLKAAIGASVVLAGASMATSGQFLLPNVPDPTATPIIGNAQDLENTLGATGTGAKFFSWPWDASVSAYYRNVIVRLPDKYIADKSNLISHFASFNTTCVHLQCLVNYKGPPETEDWRLACPCHGSQYRMPDAVPVAGPAFYLGLNPLPEVKLAIDSKGNLIATPYDPQHGKYFNGEVGFGRTA